MLKLEDQGVHCPCYAKYNPYSNLFYFHCFYILIYKNNDTAQYNNNTVIIIFNIFLCLLNNILNTDPNNAQHSVPVKPTNANKNAKNTNIGTSL
jgi:hypothetical protein